MPRSPWRPAGRTWPSVRRAGRCSRCSRSLRSPVPGPGAGRRSPGVELAGVELAGAAVGKDWPLRAPPPPTPRARSVSATARPTGPAPITHTSPVSVVPGGAVGAWTSTGASFHEGPGTPKLARRDRAGQAFTPLTPSLRKVALRTAKRLAVLALDAAAPPLLRRWAEDGTIPHLARLMDGGLVADTRGVEGLFVGATWPSFYTGLDPSDHGLYWLDRILPGTYRTQRLTDATLVAIPLSGKPWVARGVAPWSSTCPSPAGHRESGGSRSWNGGCTTPCSGSRRRPGPSGRASWRRWANIPFRPRATPARAPSPSTATSPIASSVEPPRGPVSPAG